MKYINRLVVSLSLLLAGVLPAAVSAKSLSEDQKTLCLSGGGSIGPNGDCIPKGGKVLAGGADSYLATIVNLLLYVAGAVAVLIIIYGGIRYITSTGDATRIKQAKDTILYGIIGLVIALLAYGIVNSLVANLGGQ